MVEQGTCLQKGCGCLLQQLLEICASRMKKIGGLLVEGPYFEDMQHNEGTHMVAGPFERSAWGPGLPVDERSAPAARLSKKDSERIDEESSGTVRDCELVLGKEGYSGRRRVVGLAVVYCSSCNNFRPSVADRRLGSSLCLGYLAKETHLYPRQDPSHDYSCHYVEIVMTHGVDD